MLGNSTEEPKVEKEAGDHEDKDKHFYIEALDNTLAVCFYIIHFVSFVTIANCYTVYGYSFPNWRPGYYVYI